MIEQSTVDERHLARLCSADPELASIIELEVDLARLRSPWASVEVIVAIRNRCRDLADKALYDEAAIEFSSSELTPSLRDTQECESTLARLKKLKQGKRAPCCELWDERESCFTTERARMAEIIQDSAVQRQGAPGDHPFAGQGLLDTWQADFRQCRTSLPLHEIEAMGMTNL